MYVYSTYGLCKSYNKGWSKRLHTTTLWLDCDHAYMVLLCDNNSLGTSQTPEAYADCISFNGCVQFLQVAMFRWQRPFPQYFYIYYSNSCLTN